MTDQDLDGSHIKGLCINMFHSQWHDLIKVLRFLWFYEYAYFESNKRSQVKSFYNENSYEIWKEK